MTRQPSAAADAVPADVPPTGGRTVTALNQDKTPGAGGGSTRALRLPRLRRRGQLVAAAVLVLVVAALTAFALSQGSSNKPLPGPASSGSFLALGASATASGTASSPGSTTPMPTATPTATTTVPTVVTTAPYSPAQPTTAQPSHTPTPQVTTPTPAPLAKLHYILGGARGYGCPGTGAYSLSGGAGSVLTIVNDSALSVSLYWINQAGVRVYNSSVAPGHTGSLSTQTGYTFAITDDTSRCVDVFTATSPQVDVTVS